jgi:hypothetical protein
MRIKLLPVLFAVGLLAACAEPGDGACNGTHTGYYFRLVLTNFTELDSVMLVNGRPMGEISGYGGGSANPSVADLGVFPVCDGHRVSAEAEEAPFTDLCSTADFLTCVNETNNFCTYGIRLCNELTTPDPQNGLTGCIADDGTQVPFDLIPPPPTISCGCDAWVFC